ncbi:hypothetical protein FI667_g6674, partial [Globisporangium splendens]
MDDVYAVKQTAFLGKPVSVICQNINGPCPLLAICNVLLLRGHLSLRDLVSPDGLISATDLMRVVQNHLVAANPPVPGRSELEQLTREKTLQDVIALLPSLLVGLDVNVRFHKHSNAVLMFAMKMEVVQNKSYNELVERLVEYRSVLMTESEAEEKPDSAAAPPSSAEGANELSGVDATANTVGGQDVEPIVPVVHNFNVLTVDVEAAADTEMMASSPSSSSSSLSSPSQKKSPSKQTVQVMMKERHISDADAMNTAMALLEEGPILEEFFNSSASQLTYYGLVKLHEEVRERQLCVFFRNNHFSTLFKYDGALYLLVTDAGYLDEPTVVWERLNEIDGDTEYFDANFRTLNVSETKQQSILTQQEQDKKRAEEAQVEAAFRAAESESQGRHLQNGEHQSHENEDADFLLALRLQEEEEARVNGPKRLTSSASPRRNPSPVTIPPDFDFNENSRKNSSNDCDDSGAHSQYDNDQAHDRNVAVSAVDVDPLIVDGQLMLSEEELEAQRQAERFYQEQKRQIDQQSYQLQREHQQQQQPANAPNRGLRPKGDRSDCSLM